MTFLNFKTLFALKHSEKREIFSQLPGDLCDLEIDTLLKQIAGT